MTGPSLVLCEVLSVCSVSIADGVRHVGCQLGGVVSVPRRHVSQAEKHRQTLHSRCMYVSLSWLHAVSKLWRCNIDQATGGYFEGSLSGASARGSANSQVTLSSYVNPAAKAPLWCAWCPLTSFPHESLPIHWIPSSRVCVRPAFTSKIHPLFSPNFFRSRGAVVSRNSSHSVCPSPE